MSTDFTWEKRIERDMDNIAYLLRRDNLDTILMNKAHDSIEQVIRQLISDVQSKTREEFK